MGTRSPSGGRLSLSSLARHPWDHCLRLHNTLLQVGSVFHLLVSQTSISEIAQDRPLRTSSQVPSTIVELNQEPRVSTQAARTRPLFLPVN